MFPIGCTVTLLLLSIKLGQHKKLKMQQLMTPSLKPVHSIRHLLLMILKPVLFAKNKTIFLISKLDHASNAQLGKYSISISIDVSTMCSALMEATLTRTLLYARNLDQTIMIVYAPQRLQFGTHNLQDVSDVANKLLILIKI